jgi:hypothetical protein
MIVRPPRLSGSSARRGTVLTWRLVALLFAAALVWTLPVWPARLAPAVLTPDDPIALALAPAGVLIGVPLLLLPALTH